jgi:putative PEP-CTERM system TPR-repeat lipoprotein
MTHLRQGKLFALTPGILEAILAGMIVGCGTAQAGEPMARMTIATAITPNTSATPDIATVLTPNTGATPDKMKSDIDQAKRHLARNELDQALAVGSRLIGTAPNEPIGYNVQGAAYLGKKDFSNARKSFEKALKVRPDDVPSQTMLAQLDVQQKDLASARKRYQLLLERDAKYVAALIGMANVEAASSKDKEALAWLEKAKAAHPEALAPRLALGTYYLRHKQNSAALVELDEGQRFHPDNPELLNLLGQAQAANGRKAESIATYRKLVAMRPDSPLAYYRLAIAQVDNQNLSDASESLRKAVQLKPDYVDAVVALARLEVQAGRPDQALKLAKDLQKTAPKSPAGLALEGDLLMQKQQYADAAKAYQNALGVHQTGLLAVKYHVAQTKAGKAKEADAKLERWLKDHPDDVVALEYSANEHLKDGNNKLAIDQYQRVLQKYPSNWIALNNLANLYQRENDSRAITTAEQAYKLMPGSSTTADTLGWILVGQGNTARGLELLQKAVAQSPENTEMRYHLAVALAKSGDKAKSREQLKSLLADDRKFPQRKAAESLLKEL